MQETASDFPVYTHIEAHFKPRKSEEEKIQIMASCTINGKRDRSVWIEIPAVLYNGYKGRVRITEFNIKNGMLEVLRIEKA